MKTTFYILAGSIVALFCSQIVYAGSEMEILLRKLQQKGILTAAEADEIAQETRRAVGERRSQRIRRQ